MMQPLIRQFELSDTTATWDVFYRAVRIGAAGHYTEAELIDWVASDVMPDDWGPWLDRHFTVVADDQGHVVGFFMLEADGYLNMAFVLPDYRRTGLAQRLYAAILAQAQASGIPQMTVIASRLATPFLRRQGWVDDPNPPPREGHPVLSDGPEPSEWTLKLHLGGPHG